MKNVNLSLPPAFWKTMTKTAMLRESRRPDMRDHTVDFGGDRAMPRFGML